MHQSDCARARALGSLWLDGDLSELEGALLDAHLADCPACRAFKLDAEGFTAALRGAPLDPFRGSVFVPRRARGRRHAIRLVAGTAAAAAAVSIAGVIGASNSGPSNSPPAVSPSHASLVRFASDSVEESRAKRANLLAQIDRSWVPRRGMRYILL